MFLELLKLLKPLRNTALATKRLAPAFTKFEGKADKLFPLGTRSTTTTQDVLKNIASGNTGRVSKKVRLNLDSTNPASIQSISTPMLTSIDPTLFRGSILSRGMNPNAAAGIDQYHNINVPLGNRSNYNNLLDELWQSNLANDISIKDKQLNKLRIALNTMGGLGLTGGALYDINKYRNQ